MGDRIAIMKDGEVVQVGTPEEILTDPANHYVSRFTENVDRGRIVTASSIMITQPVVARIRKDGPETVLRKMKEKNLYVLPVVDGNRQFLGEVRLKDVLALRKAGNHDLSSIVMKEVPSVLETRRLRICFLCYRRSGRPYRSLMRPTNWLAWFLLHRL